MPLYGKSQFDSYLSQLLQLVNTLLIELWDGCEHNYMKKHNGKLLQSQNLW